MGDVAAWDGLQSGESSFVCGDVAGGIAMVSGQRIFKNVVHYHNLLDILHSTVTNKSSFQTKTQDSVGKYLYVHVLSNLHHATITGASCRT